MAKFGGWQKAFVILLLFAETAIASRAQTFTTLSSFDGTNGANPAHASLVQGVDGNFYGTTLQGGSNCQGGCGTVFKITPGGTLTSLHSFCALANCVDGAYPWAGLAQALDGNFYSTTAGGGANRYNLCYTSGCGTVFRITPGGDLTTLYSFCGRTNCADGAGPIAGLIQATDGSFYGATDQGGTEQGGCYLSDGCGTVFKITAGETLTTMHTFDGADGSQPAATLIQATDKNFYGATNQGGGDNAGTVFRITSGGTLTTLYSFCSQPGSCPDGAFPYAGLAEGRDGKFYGVTFLGGANGYGTVFEITRTGTLTTLYSFCGQPSCVDGAYPVGTLVQATDGSFYGTTLQGGSANCYDGCGTIFKITPSGVLTTLHSFCDQSGCVDGSAPYDGLLQATDGAFYGTTYSHGANGDGTVFRIDTGLGPFVTFVRFAGEVGQTGPILGQGLTGTTSVSINGIEAKFTVVSDTYIRATVPEGATTGFVKVVTPSGVLKSNVPFHVIQ